MFACSFSRTAASDLAKAVKALGVEGAGAVRASTLHSFCFGVLGNQQVMTQTGRVARPLLAHEERFMVEDLKGDVLGGVYDCERRLLDFAAAWAREQHEEPGWPTDAVDKKFQQELLRWLRFHKAMLLGEIVPETLKHLKNNPHSPFRSAFDHVLVDEYQDLNRAEQDLIDVIKGDGTLTVIGDANQSIYSFKHANYEGIAAFPMTHANTHDESLLDCYRCPKRIVVLSNHLIAQNDVSAHAPVRPFAGNTNGEIHCVQWQNMAQESAGIAKFVRSRIDSGAVKPGDILILAPRREFGHGARKSLNKAGVLAHSFFLQEAFEGDQKTMVDCPAQQAFALLCLLADPEDRVSLRCWCGFGSPSMRTAARKRVWSYCEENNVSPNAALAQVSLNPRAIPIIPDIRQRYSELQTALTSLKRLNAKSVYDALFPTGSDWAEPFWAIAKTIPLDASEIGPREIRDKVQAEVTQPELPTDVDYVRVMSLHKSKGLTSKMVIVLGCNQGILPGPPYKTKLSEEKWREEQRRLFYVALTRSTDVLVISGVWNLAPKLARKWRVENKINMSEFVNDLGPTRPQVLSGVDFLVASSRTSQ